MGQIKNIKLHIVTDIKIKVIKMSDNSDKLSQPHSPTSRGECDYAIESPPDHSYQRQGSWFQDFFRSSNHNESASDESISSFARAGDCIAVCNKNIAQSMKAEGHFKKSKLP